MADTSTKTPVFKCGMLRATPGALKAFEANREWLIPYLYRHMAGDWGEVDPEDWKLNDDSVEDGSRILSVYRLGNGEKIWIITEADRASTTILLPEEY